MKHAVVYAGADLGFLLGGEGHHFMASVEARVYVGVWGLCPHWDPGGFVPAGRVRGAKPPESYSLAGKHIK